MNERIKGLAEQAEEVVFYSPGSGRETKQFNKEKFAELIVQECIDSMEKCFAGGARTDEQKDVWGSSVDTFKAWNGAIKFSRDSIKQHFGIEE